jgi:dTDP-4-amino-4,6-dideoxygalactose transaminase
VSKADVFGNRKHLPSGPVGIVATDNEELADTFHKYSHQGEGKSYHPDPLQNYISPACADFDRFGFMCGPSEHHCAIARVQLKRFIAGPLGPEKRRRNASYYTEVLNEQLPDVRTPIEKDWAYHTYLRYIIRVMPEHRDELFTHLRKRNIEAFIHYARPLPSYRICHQDNSWKDRFPVTCKLAKEVLTLPSWSTLTRKQLEYVVESIVEFYRSKRNLLPA